MQIRADQSPWYTTYTDASVEAMKKACEFSEPQWFNQPKFKHLRLSDELGAELISLVPRHEELKLMVWRVSIFITPPRTYYRAHKDGFDLRWGLNYPLRIADSTSITRWYDEDEITKAYPVHSGGKASREAIGFNPYRHKPVCQFTMQPDEIVLLDVEKFHDFHNRGNEPRVIVTFRGDNRSMTYSDAKRILEA